MTERPVFVYPDAGASTPRALRWVVLAAALAVIVVVLGYCSTP